MTTFEELAKLAQTSRNPCGKQSFDLRRANDVAVERSRFNDTGWFVHPCFHGCGRNIFHLTTEQPRTKHARKYNHDRGSKASKRSRKKARHKANQQERMRQELLATAAWEGEGGALHPSELEDT